MSIIKSRIGVFETNSSSCHSLAIRNNIDTPADAKNNNFLDVFDSWSKLIEEFDNDHDLVFNETELDFDWGPEVCCTAKEKIAYAIASDYDIEQIEEIIRRYIPDFNHIVLPTIKDMRNKPWWYNSKTDDPNAIYHGHIDHDSVGTLQWDLERYDISLEEYIFNNNFGVIIDNDNRDREEPEEELEDWKEV